MKIIHITQNQPLGILGQALNLALVLTISGLMSANVEAHRGAVDEVDACNVRVGFERVHFTAYTPTLSGGMGYCTIIPKVGPTNLVFDYEGRSLRNVSVEFEITKEPDGKRVFYQAPQKIKTGTANGMVDFREYGAGSYLAHIAIVDKDQRLDTHIPFSVGVESVEDNSNMTNILAIGSVLLMVYGVFRWATKETPDQTPAS